MGKEKEEEKKKKCQFGQSRQQRKNPGQEDNATN